VTLDRILESGEIKYYVKFCLKHPCQWAELFYYYFRRVVIRIRDKVYFLSGVKNRLQHYPNVIREHVQRNSVPTQAPKTWFLNLPSTGWSPKSGPNITSWAIPLATYSCDFQEINWFREEKDNENTFALHRFGWLLRWLSLHPAQEDLKVANSVILDWIRRVSPNKHHASWETYSASERVVNWLLYLCATKDYQHLDIGAINTLEVALLEHLDYISHHLEYHDKTCNNHILNNARALYIGGRILGLPEFSSLAKALFQTHLQKLINPEGVLQESSSHYQLLLTRAMAEVWWAASATEDPEYADYISSLVFLMISSSFYMSDFSVKDFSSDFPRVGDVSPDYPVSWFYPHPDFNHGTESWWGLWNSEQWASFIGLKGLPPQSIADGLIDWKWLATRRSPFRLFVYMHNNSEGVYPVGHGHMDFGSFLLYDTMGPIFVDRGRGSYNSDKEGQYGFSARSHNTTLINGLPLVPDCRGRRLAYKKCLNTYQKVSSNETGDERRITWETCSIDRLGKSLKWNREIILRHDHFEIIETLLNPRHIELKIETYFHISPGWELDLKHNQDEVIGMFLHKADRTYRIMVERSSGRFTMDSYRGNADGTTGWHFPDYGVRVPAITLRLSFQSSETYTSRFILCPI
jgi:Heparinase II/III-like protein/Heparinase II/III N-terminus